MVDPEERTEQAIQVQRATEVHSNWNEEGHGEPGRFSFQLILDDSAEVHVIRPAAEYSKPLVKILERSKSQYFDLERRVLIANGISLGGQSVISTG